MTKCRKSGLHPKGIRIKDEQLSFQRKKDALLGRDASRSGPLLRFHFLTLSVTSIVLAKVMGLHVSSLSPYDVVIAARRMKMSLHGKQWRIDNKRTKDLEMFGKLGFVPDIMQEKW
jgi:hypothetical protein